MRRFIVSILLMAFGTGGHSGEAPRPLLRPGARITATPVMLAPADPRRTRIGPLVFLGGWRLDSPDRAFGGWSAMIARGGRLLLVSDGGGVFGMAAAGGQLADARVGDLPAGPGSGYLKAERDSEAMAVDPATGTLWVAFEQQHGIWRYAPGPGGGPARATGMVPIRPRRPWPENGGVEAMTRLVDGRFLLFAEGGLTQSGGRDALLYPGDPVTGVQPLAFSYRPAPGHRVTDVAQLPDGRILILERRVGWPMTALIAIADPATIKAGATLASTVIARLAPPVISDNYEALAITREGDATILWVASDDNHMPVQRSLLLRFRWDETQG